MNLSELEPCQPQQRLLGFAECAQVTMHRIFVDTVAGTVTPISAEVVRLAGKDYVQHADGSLRLVESERAWSGERYISTGWHDDQAAAYAEAADLLGRRAQAVAALRLTCLAAADVVDGGAA